MFDWVQLGLFAQLDPLAAVQFDDVDAGVSECAAYLFAGQVELFSPVIGEQEGPGRRSDTARQFVAHAKGVLNIKPVESRRERSLPSGDFRPGAIFHWIGHGETAVDLVSLEQVNGLEDELAPGIAVVQPPLPAVIE